MNRILSVCGIVLAVAGCATVSEKPAVTPAAPAPLKVAVYADLGPSGIGAVEWYRLVNDSPEMQLKLVDGKGVREGALEGQDVLVMPGGNSRSEFRSLGTNGVEKMKAFIRNGGAYLGTCAGCCLLMDGPAEFRARVIPWNARGAEPDLFYPNVTVNERGAEALGVWKGDHKVRYHGGPFMWPTTNVIEGANFEVWGTLASECTYRGRINLKKAMHGAVAIVGGTYGKGRVFVTSLHPEYYETTHYLVKAAFSYLTGRTVTFPRPQRRRGNLALGYVSGAFDGIAAARAALAVAAIDGVDFQALNSDDAWIDRFGHVDVLVIPHGVPAGSGGLSRAVDRFLARGGKLITRNPKATPEGAVACSTWEELVGAVRACVR